MSHKSMSSKSFGKSFGKLFIYYSKLNGTLLCVGSEFSRIKKFAVKGGAVVDPESGDPMQPHLSKLTLP